MNVADYLLARLAAAGVDTAFTVYGGAISDIIDAFTRQSAMRYVVTMHEQAAGFCAEGYSKAKGVPGCAIATSGPGGQNLVTAVANAFYDSVPMVFVTGQVNTAFMRPDDSVRQVGFQECPIVDIVRPLTKMALTLLNNGDHVWIDDAIARCTEGRPGPVLIDIPVNVQRMEVH